MNPLSLPVQVVDEDSVTVNVGQITLPSVNVRLTVGCRPVHDPSQWKVAIMECVTFDLVSQNVLVQFRDGSEQTATPTWREQRVLRGRAWADKRSTKQHITLLLDFIGKHVVRRLNLPVTSQDWSQQAGRRAQATALAALHRKKMQQAHTKQEKTGMSISGQQISAAATAATPGSCNRRSPVKSVCASSDENDIAEGSTCHVHDEGEAIEKVEVAHADIPRPSASMPRDSNAQNVQNADFVDMEKEEWTTVEAPEAVASPEVSKLPYASVAHCTHRTHHAAYPSCSLLLQAPAPAEDKSLEEAFEEMCAVSDVDDIKHAQAS